VLLRQFSVYPCAISSPKARVPRPTGNPYPSSEPLDRAVESGSIMLEPLRSAQQYSRTYQVTVRVWRKCRDVGNCRNKLYPFPTTHQSYLTRGRLTLLLLWSKATPGKRIRSNGGTDSSITTHQHENQQMGGYVPSSLVSCSFPSSRRCVPGSKIPHLSSGQRARSSSEYRRSIFISALELVDVGAGR
jgi:hypothetical protein